MPVNLQIINPITYPEWDSLLLSSENYSFFHTATWAKVLNETYGYKPCYFTHIENKTLHVAIPFMEVKSFFTGTRGVSLPFTDYCIPVIADYYNSQEPFTFLIEYGIKNGWNSIETRGWELNTGNNSCSSPFYVHNLSLSSDEDSLLNSFRNSTKRNIKKAGREGVTVSIDTTYESVKDFYYLNVITRKNHGLPPQPFVFFENIFHSIMAKDHGVVIRAHFEGKCVAAAIFFHIGKKVLYKYGASDNRALHTRANYLVMWEAIKWYGKNGYTNFSFGITEPNNTGLMQFKNGWTKNIKTIYRLKYDINKKKFVPYRSHVKGLHNFFFNVLPVPILKSIGALFYRHFG